MSDASRNWWARRSRCFRRGPNGRASAFCMADYQSLLTRAVANLPPGSPASARQAIYDRARNALLTQLRGLRPPLPDGDIAREESALNRAIATVEAGFVPAADAGAGDAPAPAAPQPASSPPPSPQQIASPSPPRPAGPPESAQPSQPAAVASPPPSAAR